MKPIEVIKTLVIDNDDDKQLGELVRQYVKELDQSDNGVRHFADGFHEGDWKRD
tara:strand:- start:353 stop:514 length:162 start_codon:yes stop_codon:yes gene_type:complete